jgi:hypothetical protein
VLCPGDADFIEVLLDQFLNFRNLLWLETEVCRQRDGRIDPELRFAVSMLNMNMRPPFLARKRNRTDTLSRARRIVGLTKLTPA